MAPSKSDFFAFIYRRQLIWYKRHVLHLPPPWSSDPVLRDYKIINMYRELDRSTKYIMERVRTLSEREAQLINVLFFRFFNADQLYESLGVSPFRRIDAGTKKALLAGFDRMRQQGKTLFNPAYLISPGQSRAPKHVTIIEGLEAISGRVESLVAEIDAASTPEQSFALLLGVPLAGPFLACEFWTDLAYLTFFPQGWTDNDFVNIGPGAAWGLNILAGKKLDKKAQWELLRELHQVQERILPELHMTLGESLAWKDIAYRDACSHVPFLSLTNMEGALCEFRKYTRLSHGKGRRRYFTPHATL